MGDICPEEKQEVRREGGMIGLIIVFIHNNFSLKCQPVMIAQWENG